MPPDITVQLGTAAMARKRIVPICQLYQAVFSQPPFNRTAEQYAQQRQQLEQLLKNPSFGISLAWSEGELIGFLYGYTLPPNTHWWKGFLTSVDPDVLKEHDGRTFALIYLAVAYEWRRQGIGRRLVETLLAHRAEERATVSAIPNAKATQAFYRSLGWHYVGRQQGVPGEVSSLFDTYILSLKPSTHSDS